MISASDQFLRQWRKIIPTLLPESRCKASSLIGPTTRWKAKRQQWGKKWPRRWQGCRVRFACSVKWVSKQVNKSQPLAYEAFTIIAYAIPHQSAQKDVHTMFDALKGKTDIEAALPLCEKQHSSLLECAKSYKPSCLELLHSLSEMVEMRQTSKYVLCTHIHALYVIHGEQCSSHSLGY